MRIGLDLDGTIVVYDRVFHRHAVELFGLPEDVPCDKTAVRDWLRRSPAGEAGWIELQRVVYGLRMSEASLAPGLADFLRACRRAAVPISIISHKTRHSVASPPVDLHAAARGWLEANGFFAAGGFGLDPARTFFESTRSAKLERIAAEGCSVFVDDLVEVLSEPAFPASVERWLYAPAPAVPPEGPFAVFADWSELAPRLGLREEAGAGG